MSAKNDIQKITVLGLVLNFVITIIKFILGFLGNSQALIADATHSLSDSTTDFAILFGVKYWTSPPDDKHQYGHQKIESFVTIVIGIVLIFAAVGIGYNSIASINEKHVEQLKLITILGPVLSILFKEYLFRITYKVGVETNSSSVKANAWHHRSDSLSSIPVLVAIVGTLINPGLAFLDHIGAIIVSVFILKVAFEIMFSSFNELLDTSISSEELDSISKILNNNSDVLGFHKVRTRKLGSSIYVDLHIQVNGKMSVTEGHDISETVKQDLIEHNPKIIDVLVHLEPQKE